MLLKNQISLICSGLLQSHLIDIHVAPNKCAWRFLSQQNIMEIKNMVEKDVASYDAIEGLGTCTTFGLSRVITSSRLLTFSIFFFQSVFHFMI